MKETLIEDCNSSDLSSTEFTPYIPSNENIKLEVDSSVYSLLEYINLEWPSQSIDVRNKKLIAATNPEKNNGKIFEFDFSKSNNFRNVDNYKNSSKEVDFNYNRIRYYGSHIIAVSDDAISIYDKNLKKTFEKKEKFGYGLATDSKVYAGMRNGNVEVYTHELKSYETLKLHEKAVESVCVSNNILYTGSCDKKAKIYDLRSKDETILIENNCDINAIDYNKENLVITGDDKGILRMHDIRNLKNVEEINWHKSPISFVKWKNSCEFASCSDEQIALWDTSFEEEWDYHRYLRFVHQGQQFYKEISFFGDVYVSTSLDGICLFSLNLDE
ncbi:Guanine nucleotide-binding protein G(I)/G(S)/G(T) subunit beta-1 [Gurleya vavrai]